MSVKIRLMRFGKKGYVTYRIVAIDERKKRDGSYLELIGTYNPMIEPALIKIDNKKVAQWQKNGAQLSEGVRKLMKQIK